MRIGDSAHAHTDRHVPRTEIYKRSLGTRVMALSSWLYHYITLLFGVAFATVSEANYAFTIRFYEFRNPLGLQCGECESGGPPVCCDEEGNGAVKCRNNAPHNCDTRIRFLLRPFGASVETAPNSGYRYFTPGNGNNSEIFNEGPGGFLGIPNPFTITSGDGWTGRIQFHVDVIDRRIPNSGISETLAIINRFPINLELTLGASFTERTTYTGIYNISDLGFDMSFRVQCSENYFGPNCTTFCKPTEGVYTCDSEGRVICIHDGQDLATNCMACLQGWNSKTNCATCLPYHDTQSNCTQCLTDREITTNCTTCRLPGYDPSTNCTTQTTTTSELETSVFVTTNAPTSSMSINFNADTCDSCLHSVATPAIILGGVLGLSVIINIVLLIIVVVLVTKRKSTSLLPPPTTSVDDKDIEMKPNSLYGLTSGSESIMTKPNEVYGVSMTSEPSHPATYEYVNP